jgi:hypothetical protein
MQGANIYNLDTGAGHRGKLTIMESETKKFWQSDLVAKLYTNESAATDLRRSPSVRDLGSIDEVRKRYLGNTRNNDEKPPPKMQTPSKDKGPGFKRGH